MEAKHYKEMSFETYEAIVVDEDVLYTMSYRTLNNIEGKSVLGYIKTEDFIDNRP